VAEFVKAFGQFAHILVCARAVGVGLVIFVRALGLDIFGQDFSAPIATVSELLLPPPVRFKSFQLCVYCYYFLSRRIKSLSFLGSRCTLVVAS
jgi:hypothetical protein